MTFLSRIRNRLGLLKSVAIYYWKPFNRRRLKNFYRQFIRPGDLCFDIGAHVGNRTQAWLDLGATVVAVEPQQTCLKYLRRRFGQNTRIILVGKAISAASGEATMFVSSANPAISTLSHEQWRDQISHDAKYPIAWDDQMQVPVVTLDVLISEYGVPGFCKLDVENSEYDALLGLSHILPQLSFEYYPPVMQNCYLCLERLEEMGSYEFNWSFGETQRLQSKKWLSRKALESVLGAFTHRSEYGDIYARLR